MTWRSNKFWLVSTGVLLIAACSRQDAPTPVAANSYIDSRTCAECHTAIARSYANTGMAKAFHSPDAASVPNPKPYFHRASATWYQNVNRDGVWYQRWWQTGFKGREET